MSRCNTVTIRTRDGQSPASVFTPSTPDGPWPAVLLFMDGRGTRPALFELAEQIANAGYYHYLVTLLQRRVDVEVVGNVVGDGDGDVEGTWRAP